MIIDTSALIAILRNEPERAGFVDAIARAETRRISAGNYLEVAIIVDQTGDPIARAALDSMLGTLRIDVEAVTPNQAAIARVAYREFGKGSGHGARLNYGDCFAYALAKDLDEPLLFKGTDFGATDLRFVGRPAERRRLSELIAAYG